MKATGDPGPYCLVITFWKSQSNLCPLQSKPKQDGPLLERLQ